MTRLPGNQGPLIYQVDLQAARGSGAQNDFAVSSIVSVPRDRYLEIRSWSSSVQDLTTQISQPIGSPAIVCRFQLFAFVAGGPNVPPVITSGAGGTDSGHCNILVRPGDQIKVAWQGLAANTGCYARITGIFHPL